MAGTSVVKRPLIPEPRRCQATRLQFHPVAGVRYTVSTWERPGREPHAAYHSTLVFKPRSPAGWSVVENEFLRPFVPAEKSGFSDARLEWRLDERGVPIDAPDVTGHGDPNVIRNLSLFAFRPVGLVADSVCVGTPTRSTFTDAASRTRSYVATVASWKGPSVTLKVQGTVAIPGAPTWQQHGEIEVDLDDGLAGNAQMHESGPASERDRMVVIVRETPAPRPSELRIVVAKDGTLYVDGVSSDLAKVRAVAHAAVAANRDLRVVLAADKDLPHEKMVALMDALKSEGVSKFALSVAR